MPRGISIDPKTGEITGTPVLDDEEPTESYSVILRVHDNSSVNPDQALRDADMTILVGVIYP